MRIRSLLIGIVFLAKSLLVVSASAEVIDKVIVVVNGEIITQRELDRSLYPVYEKFRTVYAGDELIKKLEEAQKNILEQMIEDRLILSEAKRLNLEIDEKDVEARVQSMLNKFDSRKKFERALIEQNMTLKDLRAKYKEQIMTRRLIDQKVGSSITITPVEIADFYQAHISEFSQGEKVVVRNILIKPSDELPPEKALERANAIINRVKEGGSFSDFAKEFSVGPNASDGGLMPDIKKGDLMPQIEDAIFNLENGEMTDVIQTSLGYHIFLLEERSPAKVLDMSEVKRDIEEEIFRSKMRVKLKGWIEELKKRAYIAFK